MSELFWSATALWLQSEALVTRLDDLPRPHTERVMHIRERAYQRARRRCKRTVRITSADVWWYGPRGWRKG